MIELNLIWSPDPLDLLISLNRPYDGTDPNLDRGPVVTLDPLTPTHTGPTLDLTWILETQDLFIMIQVNWSSLTNS